MPERFLIDSNIHDKLVEEPEVLEVAAALVDAGAVVLLSTHIQSDEIERTPDAGRRARLLSVPVKLVPTYGFALGYSRLNAARLSEREPLETLRGGNLDHTEDALIAATAQHEQALLVTEDKTLQSRARAEHIEVLSWVDFRAHLLGLKVDRPNPGTT